MRTEAPEEAPAAAAPRQKESRRARRAAGKSSGGRYGQRILPKTVIGVVVLMLAAAIGFAFGGTVLSDADKSYLVTSLSVVKAATRKPGPGITVRKGDDRTDATLWTWHEERDLALLIVNKGNLPRVKWAAADAQPQYGERIFDVAGVGGAGGSITQGFVADVSAAGIMHDAAVTGPFAGGPILNSQAA